MKYRLLDQGTNGLRRIQALKDFGTVKAGDLGGYIGCEKNLTQSGDCWVYSGALVYGNARIYGNAQIYDNAWVYGDAQVYGNAHIFNDAWIYGNAQVYGMLMSMVIL